MKLIFRSAYLEEIASLAQTPDIKVITGVRRSGKSKLMEAFSEQLKQADPGANVITAIGAANTGINMSLSNIDIRKRNITASKLYMNLAIAQGALGPARDALNNADLAIRIQRNLFDFKDVFPGLVEAKIVYGDLLLKHGRPSDAKDSYADALNLAKNAVGENHPYTAAAFAAFGNYCIENNDPQAAINYFEESIEIRKNILAENHPDTAKVYYDLALAQRAVGKDSEATECLLRAKTICEKWGVESPLTDRIEAALAK